MRTYMNILNESASSGSDKINEARIEETIADFRMLVMEFNKPGVELTEFNKTVKKFAKKHPGVVGAIAAVAGLGAFNAAKDADYGDGGGDSYEQSGGYDSDPRSSSQGLRNRIDQWRADISGDRNGDDYGEWDESSEIKESTSDLYQQALDDTRWLMQASKSSMSYREPGGKFVSNGMGGVEWVEDEGGFSVDYGDQSGERASRQERLNGALSSLSAATGKDASKIEHELMNKVERS